MNGVLSLLLMLLFFGLCLDASEEVIIKRLMQWPKDLKEGNVEAVCSLFAPDLVASYPGTKDRNYADMCKQLSQIMKSKDKLFEYAQPDIEEIIIDNDMAAIRLIWTLTITDRKTKTKKIFKEKGLDIF